jgi:RNA polymerase-binding transcription factor DksA
MPRASTSSTSSNPRRPAAPTKKASVKSTSAKSSAAKKAAAKQPAKKATAKLPATKQSTSGATASEPSTAKAPVKKTAAAPVKKATAKVPVAKAAATKAAPAKKAPAKKAPEKAVAKKAAPKKVASPFDAKFLDAQKQLLIEERARLVSGADILTAEAISLAEGRDPGDVQFDEESGEGDTLQVERERDLALSAQFRGQVEEIDRALAKFDKGTYGICEVSDTPIPKERLKAIPWARERVEYKVGGFSRR